MREFTTISAVAFNVDGMNLFNYPDDFNESGANEAHIFNVKK